MAWLFDRVSFVCCLFSCFQFDLRPNNLKTHCKEHDICPDFDLNFVSLSKFFSNHELLPPIVTSRAFIANGQGTVLLIIKLSDLFVLGTAFLRRICATKESFRGFCKRRWLFTDVILLRRGKVCVGVMFAFRSVTTIRWKISFLPVEESIKVRVYEISLWVSKVPF